MLYTGGTTGNPKGVMWRHDDIIRAALNASRFGAPIDSVEQLGVEAAANETPMVLLAGGPLMHGGSQWTMGNGHVSGATVALYTQPSFEADQVLDLVQKAGVNSLTFLGDAMGRPVARAILDEPERWDLSSLVAVSNGAAPLSEGVRAEIRQALPGRFILDTYGASESGATASRVDDGSEGPLGAPRFAAGPDIEVFDEDMQPCAVGVEGMLGRCGPMPQGYYKDPVKTAATFKEVDGVRWSIPGDFARREEDGSVSVLGRGSVCINTGGEKVHPEEVEAVLLRHADVVDVAVVGTPHERWGQQVTALVQRLDGSEVSEDELQGLHPRPDLRLQGPEAGVLRAPGAAHAGQQGRLPRELRPRPVTGASETARSARLRDGRRGRRGSARAAGRPGAATPRAIAARSPALTGAATCSISLASSSGPAVLARRSLATGRSRTFHDAMSCTTKPCDSTRSSSSCRS